jgi:diguanylate cyclase (GGDEF)-like protein/PAS domain S-box-containing protein
LAALANSSDSETVIFRPQSGENSGTIIWLEYTLKLATNDESGLVEIIANGRDITQRHTYQLAIEDLHRRNSLILEAAGDGLVSFDTNGRIVYCNERATQILGWEPGELLGHYCCELFHVPSESEHASTQGDCIVNESILRQESISSSSSYLINKDGNQIQAEFVCTPMQVQGQYCGAVLVFNQRHEREHDNHQLRTQDAIINESSEAVMVTDINRRIISVNPAFIVITGYSADEAIGNTPRLLKSGVHTPDFYAAMMGSLAEKNYWAGEIWNRRKNGEIYPQWGSITAIFDENENLTSYIGVFSDVSKSKQAEERLYYLANHDSLTGLANRSKFVDHLSHLLERHRRTPSKMLAVAFIDIDQFKIINDKLGHAAGDLYLKAVSERIVSVCRTQDLVSRWGGDEFVLVMENIASRKTVIDIVTRILEVVNQPLVIQGHELEPTLSIGVSICPDNADNATDLVKAADTAMYRVKESGRNGFEFYSEGLAQANSDKFQIVSEFKRALRMNELILHYQPQVDAATGAFVGLEALVRWQHPERGLLGPISFIPLVEELGLINNLGEWVLKAACQQILEWKRQGVNCPRVAVNIAATQMNNALVDYVRQNLLQNGLSACVLEIELTESALTQDSQTISTMTQLREMGVSISIDDFGTGYSSLAHLTKFPITCIKIDKSFVDKLPGSKSDEAIVKTILALGNNLEVEVIVEGVETEEQRDFLISVGATRFQGYFYSKPLAVEEITQRLIMQESLRL